MEWDVGWTSAVAASPAVRCARRETGTSVGEVRVRGTEAVAGRYPEARGRRFRLGCPSSVNSRGRTAFRSRTRSGRFHNPFVPRCCDTRTRQGRRVEKKERGWIRTCPTWGGGVRASRDGHSSQLPLSARLGIAPRQEPSSCFMPTSRVFCTVLAHQSPSGHINGKFISPPCLVGRFGRGELLSRVFLLWGTRTTDHSCGRHEEDG